VVEERAMTATSGETPRETEDDCEFCERVRNVDTFRDLVVFENEEFLVAHQIGDDGTKGLGLLHVQTKRHVPSLGRLNPAEVTALGPLLGGLSRALEACTGAPWTYCFGFNEGVRHVHLVVGSRYAGLAEPYLRLRFAEWPGAPRGGRKEIASLCRSLRNDLAGTRSTPQDPGT
jgi:diadenosine tetraphosphate (Ap4A) HIT family hydrolase